MIMTGHIIRTIKQHATTNLISTEDYLRNEMLKPKRQQMDDKLIEPIDIFIRSHNIEDYNNKETGRKDIEIKVTQ